MISNLETPVMGGLFADLNLSTTQLHCATASHLPKKATSTEGVPPEIQSLSQSLRLAADYVETNKVERAVLQVEQTSVEDFWNKVLLSANKVQYHDFIKSIATNYPASHLMDRREVDMWQDRDGYTEVLTYQVFAILTVSNSDSAIKSFVNGPEDKCVSEGDFYPQGKVLFELTLREPKKHSFLSGLEGHSETYFTQRILLDPQDPKHLELLAELLKNSGKNAHDIAADLISAVRIASEIERENRTSTYVKAHSRSSNLRAPDFFR